LYYHYKHKSRLKKPCARYPHWPSYNTIYTWLANNNDFRDQYARAKKLQVEVLIDEILEIADDTQHDTIISENGKKIANNEWINHARLKIDTRKWLAAKLVPRLYGDKIQNEHTGLDNQNIEVNISDVKKRLIEKLAKLSTRETDANSNH